MKNELNCTQLLRAYEIIIERGKPSGFGKIYEGIEAFSDYDGYTVYLQGNGVQLSIGFHNTYHLEYEHSHCRDSFLDKVNAILK